MRKVIDSERYARVTLPGTPPAAPEDEGGGDMIGIDPPARSYLPFKEIWGFPLETSRLERFEL